MGFIFPVGIAERALHIIVITRAPSRNCRTLDQSIRIMAQEKNLITIVGLSIFFNVKGVFIEY